MDPQAMGQAQRPTIKLETSSRLDQGGNWELFLIFNGASRERYSGTLRVQPRGRQSYTLDVPFEGVEHHIDRHHVLKLEVRFSITSLQDERGNDVLAQCGSTIKDETLIYIDPGEKITGFRIDVEPVDPDRVRVQPHAPADERQRRKELFGNWAYTISVYAKYQTHPEIGVRARVRVHDGTVKVYDVYPGGTDILLPKSNKNRDVQFSIAGVTLPDGTWIDSPAALDEAIHIPASPVRELDPGKPTDGGWLDNWKAGWKTP